MENTGKEKATEIIDALKAFIANDILIVSNKKYTVTGIGNQSMSLVGNRKAKYILVAMPLCTVHGDDRALCFGISTYYNSARYYISSNNTIREF